MKGFLCSTFIVLVLAGCAGVEKKADQESPSMMGTNGKTTGGSYGRSELGHRAGPQGFNTVVIDAGHGGKDSGAISPITGQKEKDLALDTAKRLAGNLKNHFKVVMMRSNDTFVDLNERVARANRYGDAILISIHYNSSRSSGMCGPETYYWRVDSYGLATRLQKAMIGASKGKTCCRGLVRRRLRLTRNPQIPCVLVECGYLGNSAESRRINNPNYRQSLADALAEAIRTQAAIGDTGTGPLPKPINAPISRLTDAPE